MRMPEDNKTDPKNVFEMYLRDLALKFDPDDLTLTLKFPSVSSFPLDSTNIKKIPKQLQKQSAHVISLTPEEKKPLKTKMKANNVKIPLSNN